MKRIFLFLVVVVVTLAVVEAGKSPKITDKVGCFVCFAERNLVF